MSTEPTKGGRCFERGGRRIQDKICVIAVFSVVRERPVGEVARGAVLVSS